MEKLKLLRVYVGEFEKLKHRPLFEVIVWSAFRYGLSGATVSKAVMAFSAGRGVKNEKFPALWSGMPYIIDIVDKDYRINGFVEKYQEVFDKLSKDGLAYICDVSLVAGGETIK